MKDIEDSIKLTLMGAIVGLLFSIISKLDEIIMLLT